MKDKQSGIDINIGNMCSKTAYDWAKKSFQNRKGKAGEPKISVDGAFSNVLSFGKTRIGISSDGIGTKIELAERTGIYDTLGFDLVAMVADDLAANGFETTNLSNILDADYLDIEIVDELMKGLHSAANAAEIAVTGGEIAELGNRICGFGKKMHFNWCSTAIGILPEKLTKPIDGSEIEPGNVIISLKSRGFRSNGFSLIRKILSENFGENWHQKQYNKEKNWGEILLTPSLIFSLLITELIKADFQIKGIAHITGGGLADNLGRILKNKGLGAFLDDIYEPFDFMSALQKMGNVSEEQAYRIWNMGNGMLLIVDENIADNIIKKIEESNYKARICGIITNKNKIEIISKGIDPQVLRYE